MIAPLAVSTSSMMLLLLGGAALILYIAGRFAIGSMPASLDRSGTRALIAVVPVLAISIIAVFMHRPAIALHLPIACAAAAMTFGLAAVLAGRAAPPDAISNRSWTLLVPAVAMLLIAALGGRFDFAVLAALALYGLLAIGIWSPDAVETRIESDPHDPDPTSPGLAIGLWFIGVVAACVAGILAVHGSDHLDSVRGRSSDALVAVFLLAPAIVVPFFFEMLPPCRSIGWNGSISSLLKFTLVCLCLILPVTAICIAFEPKVAPILSTMGTSASTQSTVQPVTRPVTQPAGSFLSTPLAFPSLPSIAARVDLLVLVGVSLLLIPMGSAWLRPGRLEALALLVCYVLYLLLVMSSSL